MADDDDIFAQINHSILDLQGSGPQSFHRPLKRLSELLHNDDLRPFNEKLVANLDLDGFINASLGTGGSMAGSQKLQWPDDNEKCLGLTLLLIDKFAADENFVIQFCVRFYYSGSKIVAGVHTMNRELLIPFARDYKRYVMSSGNPNEKLVTPTSNKIFIVHGHDEAALLALARFLEKLELQPVVLKEQPNQGRTIIEKFEACADDVGFAIVLMTPDDVGGKATGDDPAARARQNVIFELGYFSGKLGRGKVCLLRKGQVEIPSDLFGIVYTDLDDAGAWQSTLIKELVAAKLPFDPSRFWQ
jgi:hypothetical protein